MNVSYQSSGMSVLLCERAQGNTTPTKTIAISSSHHTTYYYGIYCTPQAWSTVNPIVMSRVVAARNGVCLGQRSIGNTDGGKDEEWKRKKI
jgi:hypothetical protein